MKKPDIEPTEILSALLSHVVAFSVCFGLFALLPSLYTLASYYMAGDSATSSPQFLTFLYIFGAAALGSIALSILVFSIQLVHRRFNFPPWVPPILCWPLALAFFYFAPIEYHSGTLLGPLVATALVGGGFSLYWLSVIGSGAILKGFLAITRKIASPLNME